MSKPTASWEKLGDRFYRKIQLYSDVFDQDLELENYTISGAPYSGALALHRDEQNFYAYRAGDSSSSHIDIYSCSGKLIKRLNWDKGVIKGLGWSEDEELLVVSQDGTVRVYSGLSDNFNPFTLGHGAEEHGVVSCKFWMSGFIALLGNNQLVCVTDFDEPRPKLLAEPPTDPISAWTVIPPAYTLSKTVEVLVSTGKTIYVVDASDAEDRMLDNGPFKHLCVSPNGRFIALYTEDGKVWVISSDFQEKLSEYNTKVKTLPKDMQWCGNDAVVLAWDDEVHLLGPNGASTKYYYDGWVHIVPDMDGVRLFTNESCEFLQKVPDVSEDTFKFGSNSPASILLDAADSLEKKSPKADEDIQLIKANLAYAVDSCVAAAGHEYDISWQKQCMKAASFGKTILEHYDSDEFVAMTEMLRVLNAVRFYEIGLPLSYEQLQRLNPERLVQRLVNRQEYLIALRLSEYLKLPTDRIYIHWASQKVRISTESEEVICKRIVQKFNGKTGISFEKIAQAAYDEGRQKLATELLNHEPVASKQVPLLLNMEEDTIALDKAIDSGDTDLILFVLSHIRKKLPLASFFRTINTRPVASALVEFTALEEDRDLLKDLYYQDDRRIDGALLLFGDALKQPSTSTKVDKLRIANKLIHDAKDATFLTRSMEETSQLLRLQELLDNDPSLKPAHHGSDEPTENSPRFAGLSLNATLVQLIVCGQHKRAQKFATDYKLSDRTFWWLRLRALVNARNWRELEEIAHANRKSVIGWEPFYKEILAAGNKRLAGTIFIPKCTNLQAKERAKMYVECDLLAKATEEAIKAKDKDLVEELRAKAEGREAIEVERLVQGSNKK